MRDAHGKFFDEPFLFKIEIFAIHAKYSGSVTNGLRRGCCVWCNTEAATPPQPLHSRGQHGGGDRLKNI